MLHQIGDQSIIESKVITRELRALLLDLKYDPSQPREPAGSPEGGRFAAAAGAAASAVGAASREVGSVVAAGARRARPYAAAAARVGGRAARATARYVGRLALYEAGVVGIGAALMVGGVLPSVQQRVVDTLGAGLDFNRGARLDRARAQVAARQRVRAERWAPGSTAGRPSGTWQAAGLNEAWWTKQADDRREYEADDLSWFVNVNGVLFAVIDDGYYPVETAGVAELRDLPAGDYTSEELATVIADAAAGAKMLDVLDRAETVAKMLR